LLYRSFFGLLFFTVVFSMNNNRLAKIAAEAEATAEFWAEAADRALKEAAAAVKAGDYVAAILAAESAIKAAGIAESYAKIASESSDAMATNEENPKNGI
jgi:hypothetical protein